MVTLRGYDAGLAAGPREDPKAGAVNEATDSATVAELVEALGADAVYGTEGWRLYEILIECLPACFHKDDFSEAKWAAVVQAAREECADREEVRQAFFDHKMRELREAGKTRGW